jgi:hypothetical protein
MTYGDVYDAIPLTWGILAATILLGVVAVAIIWRGRR